MHQARFTLAAGMVAVALTCTGCGGPSTPSAGPQQASSSSPPRPATTPATQETTPSAREAPPPAAVDTKPVSMAAKELIPAYESDPEGTMKKFEGKTLEVSGVVKMVFANEQGGIITLDCCSEQWTGSPGPRWRRVKVSSSRAGSSPRREVG
jgi:hypothetical protein